MGFPMKPTSFIQRLIHKEEPIIKLPKMIDIDFIYLYQYK